MYFYFIIDNFQFYKKLCSGDRGISHGIPGDSDSDSGHDILSNKLNQDEFYIPTSDAGIYPFEIEKNDDISENIGINISGHVLLNFVGKRYRLKSSSIHKYFLQRLVSTTIGNSISLLYPEGMLYPCIFR